MAYRRWLSAALAVCMLLAAPTLTWAQTAAEPEQPLELGFAPEDDEEGSALPLDGGEISLGSDSAPSGEIDLSAQGPVDGVPETNDAVFRIEKGVLL